MAHWPPSHALRMRQVHLDIKPRNFCTAHSPAHEAAGSWQQQLQIYIIDFEGSKGIPDKQQAGWEAEFFGTADYAGSTALLQCTAGPCDDVESLCYRCIRFCWHGMPACMLRYLQDIKRSLHIELAPLQPLITLCKGPAC